MLVIEIDMVDPESLERRVAGLAHVFRIASNAEIFTVLAAHVRELRREHHLVVTVGLDDIIVVHTEDATLIASKQQEESVRQIVERLEEKGWDQYL